MKYCFLIFLSLSSFLLKGQNISFKECWKSTAVFELAEKMPIPSGGTDSLKAFFQLAINSWGLNNVSCQLKLRFIINGDGSACLYMITDPPSNLSISNVVNTINEMPGWKPAIQNGHQVDCYVNLKMEIESGIITKIIYGNPT